MIVSLTTHDLGDYIAYQVEKLRLLRLPYKDFWLFSIARDGSIIFLPLHF